MAHLTEAHTASREENSTLTARQQVPCTTRRQRGTAVPRPAHTNSSVDRNSATTNMNLHKPEVLDVMSPFFSTGRAERGFESQTDLVELRAFDAECFCRSSVSSKQGRVGPRQGLIFGFFVGWL